MAQAVNSSLMEAGFLDVSVGLRHIAFGLIVVVVTDEKLNGVFREEGTGIPDTAARRGFCCAQLPVQGAERAQSPNAIVKVFPVPVAPRSV